VRRSESESGERPFQNANLEIHPAESAGWSRGGVPGGFAFGSGGFLEFDFGGVAEEEKEKLETRRQKLEAEIRNSKLERGARCRARSPLGGRNRRFGDRDWAKSFGNVGALLKLLY